MVLPLRRSQRPRRAPPPPSAGGPFPTKKAAEEELAATLARLGGGAQVPDRALTVAAYLEYWLTAKKLAAQTADLRLLR